MKAPLKTLCTLPLALSIAVAQADSLPTRKPGLWEISVSTGSESAGHQTKMKQCTDEKTDAKMLQIGADAQGRATCSKNEISRTSDGYSLTSVCSLSGSTITSKGSFTGDFSKSYSGELTTTFEPPLFGQTSSSTRMNAVWLGDCTGGLKPGDIVMPNGTKTNIDRAVASAKQATEMLNSPELANAMKQLQHGMDGQSQAALQQMLGQMQRPK